MNKGNIQPLASEDLGAINDWLMTNPEGVPEAVVKALMHYQALVEGLSSSRYKLSTVLSELRRALGIVPKTERRKSGDPLGPMKQADKGDPKSERQKLESERDRMDRLAQWHRKLWQQKRKSKQVIEKKLENLAEETEEEIAAQEAADAEAVRAEMERMTLGTQGEPSLELESVAEALMSQAPVTVMEKEITLKAPLQDDGAQMEVLDTIVEKRERYDFAFTVTRISVNVEKTIVVDESGERRMISPSTSDLGPPRCHVTWNFLAYMTVLVVQYAMPLNRVAKLVSTSQKRFKAGSLGRHLHDVAERFAPIYLALFDQLADSEILSGDDTKSRVIEVKHYFENPDSYDKPPWDAYETQKKAHCSILQDVNLSLGAELASELGFAFEKRNGKGKKQALNTTIVSGRTLASDPRSTIVLYRSHLGGFGNLLEMLQKKRRAQNKQLIVQSDLSSVNTVSDSKLCELFDITYIGCSSHARRPFALYEDEDPINCDLMLHLFKGIAIHEQGLDRLGRNYDNVSALRAIDSRAIWHAILELAHEMAEKWSKATKLGNGARYISRHFDKLTAYLDDPRLHPTNNFSERMLRTEKLIQASALFRKTLEGRFALDIMRTVLQTAVAADIPLTDYLLFVLKTDPNHVAQDPEAFTPWAYAQQSHHNGDTNPDQTH